MRLYRSVCWQLACCVWLVAGACQGPPAFDITYVNARKGEVVEGRVWEIDVRFDTMTNIIAIENEYHGRFSGVWFADSEEGRRDPEPAYLRVDVADARWSKPIATMGHSGRTYIATMSLREDQRRSLIDGKYDSVILELRVAALGRGVEKGAPRSKPIKIPKADVQGAIR